ncbi:hypothetical protein LEP1GSC043_0046 [Leptospira weilii str. Ecochallenge]|uniref:Uncharacterized protein n=1 Tax=Leptospira weilii str. Ecochallenge TaxID=1049986 RepID=N1UIG1_9LEPT|nr:hypothetical protein LEP1GSC043_0046 [Leptospira weilii str. Ecochallenge]
MRTAVLFTKPIRLFSSIIFTGPNSGTFGVKLIRKLRAFFIFKILQLLNSDLTSFQFFRNSKNSSCNSSEFLLNYKFEF